MWRGGVVCGVLAVAIAVVGSAPGRADAAVIKAVTTGEQLMPNTTPSASNVALTGVDISRAFVVCSVRTPNTNARTNLATCNLNNGGAGGAAQLTITITTAPGTTTRVRYDVAEFESGVSVKRGSATFTGPTLTPDVGTAPDLGSGVDCTKSFVLTSARSTLNSQALDEQWTVRAVLRDATLAVCDLASSGVGTSLALTRLEGHAAGVVTTIDWQVVTYEGAFVQRGLSCIGPTGGPCTTNPGFTAGTSNGQPLLVPVDANTAALRTVQAAPAVNGIDNRYHVRAELTGGGTGVRFVRVANTTPNQHVEIAWEAVWFFDGTTVQGSGITPTTISAGGASVNSPNLAVIDVTRTVPFHTISGGTATMTGQLGDLSVVPEVNGSNGSTDNSNLTFRRLSTTVAGNLAWLAVSFFRCLPASGVGRDSLCGTTTSTTGDGATVAWSAANTVMIARSTASIAANPTNGQTYCVTGCPNNTVGAATVVYPPTSALPPITEKSFSQTGLTLGTTVFYKAWARSDTTIGACTTPPCWVGGTQTSVRPQLGPQVWSARIAGGSALNPPIAGNGNLHISSNAGRIVTLNGSTGAQLSAIQTHDAQQAYVTWYQDGAETVLGVDQSGWLFSYDPLTGVSNWMTNLVGEAFQAGITVQLRAFSAPPFDTVYPVGNLVIAGSRNTSDILNYVHARLSTDGSLVWLYVGSPGMDQIIGQPVIDYTNNRLWVASRAGIAGIQPSLWVVNTLTGTEASVPGGQNPFAITHIEASPVMSIDGARVYVGRRDGRLHAFNTTTLTQVWQNNEAFGNTITGVLWTDLGVLYFVTTNGRVWAVRDDGASATKLWDVAPVVAGTVGQLVLACADPVADPGCSELAIFVGGSDGRLYQLRLSDGATVKSFQVGDGTSALGDASSDDGAQVFIGSVTGTVYRIDLPLP